MLGKWCAGVFFSPHLGGKKKFGECFSPHFPDPWGEKTQVFSPHCSDPWGEKLFIFPPFGGKKARRRRKFLRIVTSEMLESLYENAFQKGKSAVERKKFRLRRARSSIRSFVYRYIRNTLFLHVNKQISPPQAPIFFGVFSPHSPDPWGEKNFFPPIIRTPGGKTKKVFSPQMGGKINSPG